MEDKQKYVAEHAKKRRHGHGELNNGAENAELSDAKRLKMVKLKIKINYNLIEEGNKNASELNLNKIELHCT